MSTASARNVRLVPRLFFAPVATLRDVVSRRSVWPALLAATLVASAQAVVLAPRLDLAAVVEQKLARSPAAHDLTPHERQEALDQARKVSTVGLAASGLLGPSLTILSVAVVLWIGFRVAGARPAFAATAAVASYGLLPSALGVLLSIPALAARERIMPTDLERLLPANLLVFAPAGSTGPLASLLGAIDVFALWSLVLVILGMAEAAGTSRGRAAAATLVLFGAYVALTVVSSVPGARAP